MRRTSRRLYLIILLLALLVLGNGLFLHARVSLIQGDAGAINASGMVRGSIQRAAKMVLTGEDASGIMRQVDCWLGLGDPADPRCVRAPLIWLDQATGLALVREWTLFKRLADQPLADREYHVQLISSSERLWILADEGVRVQQEMAEHKLGGLRLFYYILAANVALLALVGVLAHWIVQASLERQTVTDKLTGVYNRRGFDTVLERQVALAERMETSLGLISFDLDHFKRVNDRFGHGVGDRVLRLLAQAMLHAVRSSDTVCRVGGEEFAVICPETGLDMCAGLAEKLRLAAWHLDHGPVGRVTISLGVAELRPGEGPEQLAARADRQLYKAKEAGRDRVCVDREA